MTHRPPKLTIMSAPTSSAPTSLLTTPQEGVDGSGGVGGFAKPPMAPTEPTAAANATDATDAAASSSSAATSPTAHPKNLLTERAMDKFLKAFLPTTSQPNLFVLPNTQQALSKLIEHFTMLLTFVSVDMCAHNGRRTLHERDVLLALKEIGMGALVEPLQQSLHIARPRKVKTKKLTGPRVGIQMSDLIRKKLIQPGVKKLTETYRGQTFYADLREDGMIVHDGNEFHAPSSFSIYCRKIVGTHQDSSNGWQAVRYVEEGGKKVKLIVFKDQAIADNKVSIQLNIGGSNEDDGGVSSSSSSSSSSSTTSTSNMDVEENNNDAQVAEEGEVKNTKKRTATDTEKGKEDATQPPTKKAKVSKEEEKE